MAMRLKKDIARMMQRMKIVADIAKRDEDVDKYRNAIAWQAALEWVLNQI